MQFGGRSARKHINHVIKMTISTGRLIAATDLKDTQPW